MKKLILFLLLCVTAWSNAIAVSINEEFIQGDLKYKITKNYPRQVSVVGPASKSIVSVDIPETVSYKNLEYSVTSIDNYAFSSCRDLASVEIANGVKTIGEFAFYFCPLTSLTIPNSVTSLGESSFANCSKLSSLTISEGLITISPYAFYSCSALRTLTIPNSVTSIGECAFYLNRNLSSVTIPNSVKSIGKKAFDSCYNLNNIEIPNSVTSIGDNAFIDCRNLSRIIFHPESHEIVIGDDWLPSTSGTFTFSCKLKNYQDELKIPETWTLVADHNNSIQHTPAIAETCTTDGNVDSWTCDLCNTHFSDANGENEIAESSWLIPAHHFCSLVDAVAETCTTDGNNAYYDCDRCDKFCSDAEGKNEIAENSWVIPAHHFCTQVEAVAETCTTDGNNAYYDCERCDKFCSDAEGKNEIAENSWIKTALGHDWEDIYDEPNYTWTHHCKHDAAHDVQRKQLCFDAKADNSKLGWGQTTYDRIYNVQYCRDWSDDWTNLEAGEAVTLNTGDKIWIRCFTAQNFRMGTFNMDGTFEASGSIMSMLNDEPDSKVIPYEDCFFQLFNGRHGLTKAPALPATTLTKGCYSSMFQSCSNLVSAPILPATVLAEGCYADMFYSCSKLENAPVLPAETLVKNCYQSMFSRCNSLASLTLNAKDANAEGCLENILANNILDNPANGILHITDELALANANLQLPSNWKTDKVGIHANEDPNNAGNYYATFYDSKAEYSVPEGTTAYTGTVEGDALKMTAEDDNIIPAGEAVMLKGNTPDVILTISDTNKDTTPGNKLLGSDTDTTAPANCYIFTYAQNGLGFYQYAADKPLGAHKAYLVYNKANLAKGFRMVFDDEDTVASIVSPLGETEEGAAIYNLQGVRMNKLQKGINIVNGKKVVIK